MFPRIPCKAIKCSHSFVKHVPIRPQYARTYLKYDSGLLSAVIPRNDKNQQLITSRAIKFFIIICAPSFERGGRRFKARRTAAQFTNSNNKTHDHGNERQRNTPFRKVKSEALSYTAAARSARVRPKHPHTSSANNVDQTAIRCESNRLRSTLLSGVGVEWWRLHLSSGSMRLRQSTQEWSRWLIEGSATATERKVIRLILVCIECFRKLFEKPCQHPALITGQEFWAVATKYLLPGLALDTTISGVENEEVTWCPAVRRSERKSGMQWGRTWQALQHQDGPG